MVKIVAALFALLIVLLTKSSSSRPELFELLTLIAQNHQHGFRDDAVPHDQLAERIMRGELVVVQCGVIADTARLLLEQRNYQVKVVSLRTLEPPIGDDGHVLLSVLYNDTWTVVDFTTNRFYWQDITSWMHERASFVLLAEDSLLANGEQLEVPSDIPHDVERWYNRIAQSWRWLF